ncbi:hypothetical protein ID858_11505 [Xenorhabdus sp. DI]|uniref:hypothetical protein n=1 Tax=Xenorhabdus doucetiae TaxID=351671 RepID=UPI00199C2956|nr:MULTISPECIES: hypothetical protein [unclassified Xenorhabdus]MBD2783699.1 hypothetical protein [Xenorhabdus sp. 3]MBD2789133.1 hypothetical protein [Xenorhabdus sp. DI]
MKIAKCKKCKEEVSTDAKVCPHCGEKYPGATTLDALLGLGFIIVICAVIYYFVSGDDNQESSDKIETASKTLGDYKKEPQNDRKKIVENFISHNKIDKSYTDSFYNCLSQMSYTTPTDMKLDEALGWCQVDFTRNPDSLNDRVNLDTFMSNFSGWDGSYRPLEKMIQKTMHDDSSYQHVETTYRLVLNQKPPYAIVKTKVKGTNLYGAVATSTITVKVDVKTGKIIELIE